ncbi:ABC transporter ATP-binding protein [Agromyces sp. H3Y2-19a]|uniref:ABC transporter ATP-binding protein n=1 Tax=Agromyces chromiiresistens TaxID=3030835 RepID=UPI0023B8BF9C|nr:ABC transporter ATP-binding protein [Agromyces chromiiresistens]MDF0515323.1 ABC transporter ATP-binding protein [Agromyces chromiiresistens]
MTIEPGEVHALIGLNGAGKSTLMKLLLGMLRPERGVIRIAGTDSKRVSPGAWSRFGQAVEAPLVYGELTVRGNLAAAAALRGIPRRDRDAVVGYGIDALDLARYSGSPARTLSLGNRQRLGLAIALQHRPDYLVLDEPTNALDPRGTLLLRDLLLERAHAGAAVLISSHHLDEVARIADRITVMNAGRLVGTLDPTEPNLEHAFFSMVLDDDRERARDGDTA